MNNKKLKRQQVIYDKTSGEIKMVVSIDRRPFSISELAIGNRLDISNLDTIITDDDSFIDIRRDYIEKGILCSGNTKNEVNMDDIFLDVSEYTKNYPCKIGMVTPWQQQCGIAKYSEDLVNNLLNNVVILSEREDNINNTNLEVIPCWGKDDKSYNNLLKTIIKNKIDIVHVQYNHGLMNAGELKRFGDELKYAKIKSYITLHSTKGGVSIFAEHFDNVIVHSKVCEQDLIDEGVKKDKILRTRIGSFFSDNHKTKEEARILRGLDKSRKIIANFGFFLPQKGIQEQIYAIEILKEYYPDILLLCICAIHKVQNESKSTKYYEECRELVKHLKLEENVMFITDFLPFSEIYEYLFCADVISMPYIDSAAQGTSSAGRTAMSVLRPMVITRVDIFDDLEGIVPKVEPRDFKQLAITIDRILRDKTYATQIILNIKNFVEETSWENIAKEHSLFYRAFGDLNFHIEGQVFSYFSASIVNRRLACALDKLGVNVSLSSVNMAENKLIELGDNSKKLIEKPRTHDVCMRHYYPPKFSEIDAELKIIYLPVETTSVPNNPDGFEEHENWIDNINKFVDVVWTYTQHGKEILSNMGIIKPIVSIKCGFNSDVFNPDVIPVDFTKIKDSYYKKVVDVDNETFVFMFCGHAQPRKNFTVILEAYLREFSLEDNVLFVIKSYDGGEVHKLILHQSSDIADEKAISIVDLPKTLYIYEDTSPDVLPRYYRAANCMVQCSRAEGFGLPIIEAMAMGVPSIVTPWSGPVDFTTSDNSFYVKYELVESSYHVQSKTQKSYWAEVKVADLQKVMRYVFDHSDEVKKKGLQGIHDMKKWTDIEAGFDVIRFLKGIR